MKLTDLKEKEQGMHPNDFFTELSKIEDARFLLFALSDLIRKTFYILNYFHMSLFLLHARLFTGDLL